MVTETINGIQLTFETANDSFSPLHIDKGTLAMLSTVTFSHSDKVLDLGCGYGVVGILAARLIGEQHVVMSDIEEQSVALSKKNAEMNGVGGVKVVLSDGFRSIQDMDFTRILSNPPYHSVFANQIGFV